MVVRIGVGMPPRLVFRGLDMAAQQNPWCGMTLGGVDAHASR
jgi:hypothetical protein